MKRDVGDVPIDGCGLFDGEGIELNLDGMIMLIPIKSM